MSDDITDSTTCGYDDDGVLLNLLRMNFESVKQPQLVATVVSHIRHRTRRVYPPLHLALRKSVALHLHSRYSRQISKTLKFRGQMTGRISGEEECRMVYIYL